MPQKAVPEVQDGMLRASSTIWDNWDNAQQPSSAQALGFVRVCKASSPPKCSFSASGIGVLGDRVTPSGYSHQSPT